MIRSRLFLFLAFFLPVSAWSDIVVVVNAANPVRSMSQAEVAALYLGRARTYPGGEFALVFDQARDSAVRERFFKRLAGMSLVQVNTYWSRLMFAGQELPPQALPSEQSVLDIVRRNPGAIGYINTTAMPADNNLRVILQLKE